MLLSALQQVIALFNEGYLKGGTDDASVIGFGDRWYRPKDIRFYNDEPIRHRLGDLLVSALMLQLNASRCCKGYAAWRLCGCHKCHENVA